MLASTAASAPAADAMQTPPQIAAAAATGGEVVNLDTFEVSAAKHKWRHARSAHFEALASVENTKLVSRIIQRAEQIIGAFGKNNALFRMPRELPAKIIFINDKGVERYLVRTGNEDLQHARDKPPEGVKAGGARRGAARQVSARAFYDDEQAVFIKLITQEYLEGTAPFETQVRENALDLALNYLQVCVDIHAGSADSVPWLVNALDSLRGHTAGAAWRLPDGFESPVYHFPGGTVERPAWFTIDDDEMTFGRYCLACEIPLLRGASDFPRGGGEEALARQKQLWRAYAPAPNASLGDFLAAAAPAEKSGSGHPDRLARTSKDAGKAKRAPRKTFAAINAALTARREALDFVYYCTFAADARSRAAFAQLVASAGRQPVTEAGFRKFFGEGYDEFRGRVYDFFAQLGEKIPEYKNNPWGPPAVVMVKFSPKELPPPVVFRAARRGETARIAGDWFALCGAGDMARQTLLKAGADPEQTRGDHEFMAALGLSEAAHGRPFAAIAQLEAAMAAKTVARPRAWRVLAQLRLENILSLRAPGHRLTKDELATIIDPLAEAFAQARMSPQTSIQLARVWSHTDIKPPREYLDALASLCRALPDNVDLLEAVFPLLAQNGRAGVARQLAEMTAQCVLGAEERRRLEILRGGGRGRVSAE